MVTSVESTVWNTTWDTCVNVWTIWHVDHGKKTLEAAQHKESLWIEVTVDVDWRKKVIKELMNPNFNLKTNYKLKNNNIKRWRRRTQMRNR